ncbi:MAG: sugar transporter [Myxococcaceae bacterium]|nr:sugar transporter [Myxococcaceae bacterium]
MSTPPGTLIRTNIPLRLDRLPWSRFHWLVVFSLGITWVLDGLEVTIVGSVASVLEHPETLALTSTQVGWAGSAYLAGAISGALVFGHLTDRFGRKRLFLVTLLLYVAASALTACSFNFLSFALCRALTGAAIGGEYAAINSAIDELLPARVRGRADLSINGTYWLGTALGALLTLVLLDPALIPIDLGWRLSFGIGAMLTVAVVLVRRHVPESPRWLLRHGRQAEAEQVVQEIEQRIEQDLSIELPAVEGYLTLDPQHQVGLREVVHVVLHSHRARSFLCLVLMVAQAFFYNAIFFTYSLLLTRFFAVPADRVGLYIIPFAVANFLGPLVLGRLFDSVGRRPLIVFTYGISGLLLLSVGLLFRAGMLTATTQAMAFSLVFFFGSAAASSAYLSVSELFPIELRALAIALFYAVGTATGGLCAPALFGALIQTGEPGAVFVGYAIGAGLMLFAALVAAWLGVAAEGRSLEELSAPLSAREP